MTTIVFAVYEQSSNLRKDILIFLRDIAQDTTFEVLLVYNGKLNNLGDLDPNILCIPNRTQGYDLNCYIRGFLECRLLERKKLIFLNNSIFISDSKVFLRTLLLMQEKLKSVSVVSFSLSHEIRKHFQSFLFGINLTNDPQAIQIITEACIKYDRAFSRDEVIELFELKSYEFVRNELKLNYSILFEPDWRRKLKSYFMFLIQLGFLDNISGLFRINTINFSIFLKSDIEKEFGFKKIKSTSFLNKLNEN